jgi:hypothetical protein
MGLGSGIRDPGSEKTYSGSRIQGSKRHRIPDPDPQHWIRSETLVPTTRTLTSFIFKELQQEAMMIIPQQQQQQQQLEVMYLRLAESPCVEAREGWSCPLPYCGYKYRL